jgi:multiple sugar transport system permease protein
MNIAANKSTTANTGSHKRQNDDGWVGVFFALPQLILFAIFLLAPTVYGLYISLFKWHILAHTHPFVGLENYHNVLHDDIFWIAFWNTVYYVILSVPIGNLVSLLLAIGISQVKWASTFYKICYYVPTIISIAVVAVLWAWMFNSQAGLFNMYLKSFNSDLRHIGIPVGVFHPVPWLSNVHAGGNMILYLAGINNIPRSYYEAAVIDGANSWERFWAVTWPLLKPTTLFCLVFSVLGAFQVFGQSYVLFQGGSGPGRSALTLALYMFQQGFSEFQIGYGTAIAYVIFAIILVLTLIEFRLLGRREDM